MAGFISCDAGFKPLFLQFSTPVHEQIIVVRVIGNVNIGHAVIVKICEHYPQSAADGTKPLVGSNVTKAVPFFVEKKRVDQRFELLGTADVLLDSERISLAHRMVGDGPVHVMADVEIGKAVTVDISPAGAGTPGMVPWSELFLRLPRIGGPPLVRFVVKERRVYRSP